jgi:hypothetical protein
MRQNVGKRPDHPDFVSLERMTTGSVTNMEETRKRAAS